MQYNVRVKVTKAKAKVAALGSTLVALLVFLGPLQDALADDKLTASEATPIFGALVVLIGTVYGVWRVPNKPVAGNGADQS